MKNKRVKFKRFVFREGYTWKAGGEGKVIAETETHYKVKTNWFSSEWVYKNVCEEIIKLNQRRSMWKLICKIFGHKIGNIERKPYFFHKEDEIIATVICKRCGLKEEIKS